MKLPERFSVLATQFVDVEDDDLLDRLKLRLEIKGEEEDELLEDILDSARALFLYLRYPFSNCPLDDEGDPVIDRRWNNWILRAAIELYSRMGSEGQQSHSENGISRSYDAGTVSQALRLEVTPVAQVVRR